MTKSDPPNPNHQSPKKPMFPNPANYYLPTPEQFENEIVELDYMELARLNWRLSAFLDDLLFEQMEINEDTSFEAEHMSNDFDQWVLTLKADELINLVRWVTERLAYLLKFNSLTFSKPMPIQERNQLSQVFPIDVADEICGLSPVSKAMLMYELADDLSEKLDGFPDQFSATTTQWLKALSMKESIQTIENLAQMLKVELNV